MLTLATAVGQSKRATNDGFNLLRALDAAIQQGRGTNFQGATRTYRTRVEGTPGPPDEDKPVGLVATEVLAQVREILEPTLDANLTRDVGNTQAAADVIVDGHVILAAVPATFLLTLEKQIGNLYDILRNMPTRPLGVDWQPTSRDGVRQSPRKTTERHGNETQYKLSTPIPDKGIPEQVLGQYTTPVILGWWDEISFTGALSHNERQTLMARARAFLEAVKAARIKANGLEVEPQSAGAAALSFILDGEFPAG